MDTKAQDDYIKDTRIACKYGIKCYQKNPAHFEKYKHPPKQALSDSNNSEPPIKKRKIDNIEEKCKTDNEISDIVPSTSNVKDDEEANGEAGVPESNDDGDKLNDKQDESPNTTVEMQNTPLNIDEKEFIKNKFLVEMPSDFYKFWDFCKNLNKLNPLKALNDVGLTLVGPFEVLAEKFNNIPEKKIEEYVLHWRYFYDPPEFQTVIKRNDNSGYHIGYFRDSPNEMPVFLAYNFAKTDGTFTIIGDNLFAAVGSFMKFLKKRSNPFMQTHITRYSSLIQKEAEKLKLSLSVTTPKISSRNKKILARTFNKVGMVVPYNKKTQVGYRPLSISNKELQALLTKLGKAGPTEKDKLMAQLQVVLTNTNIAIDECDFGTGLELGLDILCSGVESLNAVAGRFLAASYRLVSRESFAVIAESHMKKREKDINKLSVL